MEIFFLCSLRNKKNIGIPLVTPSRRDLRDNVATRKGNARAYDKTAQSKHMGSIDGRKKKIYNVGIQPQSVEKKDKKTVRTWQHGRA